MPTIPITFNLSSVTILIPVPRTSMTWPWRITWLYLSVMLLLPMAALVAKALSLPPAEIWRIATDPIALSAYGVTLTTAFAAAMTNGIAGLAIAWVLLRYRFPGRRWLDAALDLPLALPAAVTGLTLVTVYGDRGWLGSLLLPLGIQVSYSRLGVYMAMLFSSLPFVVRAVQPLLVGLDSALEEAAAGLGASPGRRFREVLLPLLLPATLTGVALSFARAVGEYGAVVLIASNLPFKDLIAAVLIMQRLEQYDMAGATVLGLVMLLFSLAMLWGINLLQAWKQPRRGGVGFTHAQPQISSSAGAHVSYRQAPDSPIDSGRRWLLLGAVLFYLAVVLLVPAANLFFQALRGGLGPLLETLGQREFLTALGLTLTIAAIALPLNTAFGLCAAWAIAHPKASAQYQTQSQSNRCSSLLLSLIDLPLSISPVVAGVMIVLLYGRGGWFSSLLEAGQVRIVFALPGMALATVFVTLPFVVREVLPVWQVISPSQAEAARSLGVGDRAIFCRLTLPQIRGSLGYGMVLTCARAIGEFGAVMVVSGSIIGKTQTLSLYVEDAYKNYEAQSAYIAAMILTCLALTAVGLRLLLDRPKA